MTSLQSTQVSDVLQRLYADANKNDSVVLPRVHAEVARLGGAFDDRNVTALLDDAFIPVSSEVGRLLYTLVRARRPKVIVEFGTSFGLSTIHIAAALKDNGEGKLIATELNANKALRATEHIREAGLSQWAEVRQGDAFQTLVGITGIDFLLLDAWKGLYLPMLKKLEPVLNPGSLVVADDIKLFPEMLQSYVDYVRDPENGYTSNELPIDDGLELSLRK